MLVITGESSRQLPLEIAHNFTLQGERSLFVTESSVEVDNIGEYLAGDARIAAQKYTIHFALLRLNEVCARGHY